MNFIKNESAEKLRGGYYTSPDIADFLFRWIDEIAPTKVLEPSCGDGVFLRAIARARSHSLTDVVACEIVSDEAAKARAVAAELPQDTTATVIEGDFLAWALAELDSRSTFDAVVGNPPFIRYQYLARPLQDRAEMLFRRFRLPFTRHTNAWVPFVIASLALLRPGGRMGMVVPAEILHVLHARSLRDYLLRVCTNVLVLDPDELLFDNALQGVVLLLAEKAPVGRHTPGVVAVSRVQGRSFLRCPANEHFAKASFVSAKELGPKWMPALLTSSERQLLNDLRARRLARPFREVGTAVVGIVTGANKFFLVPDETVERFSLGEFALPMFGRSEHVPGVLYDDETHQANRRLGYPTNFLWFREVETSALAKGPRSYIARGESMDFHTRYKCRIRSPWYNVPSVFSTPMGMLKRCHDYPRLVLNTVGALTTDTVYRVTPTDGMSPKQLVFAFVNSLTALSAELEGRHYGGGVLELVPSEINRVLVPSASKGPAACRRLDALFRSGTASIDILAAQDRSVLVPLGLRPRDCDTLRGAWWRLRSRRQRAPTKRSKNRVGD